MDNAAILQTIEQAMARAGLDTRSGPLQNVMATIEGALGHSREPSGPAVADIPDRPSGQDQTNDDQGEFLALSRRDGRSTRHYKLFVPPNPLGKPMPLVVMLHGCKQNPDDFAAGTQMNTWALREGFVVAYPSQTRNDNGANCWNWFEPAQQTREGSEPRVLAAIVHDIIDAYPIDRSRVIVAGLSAGAAMAVILAHRFPELFTGLAVHSGLPLASARDVPSAFAAMRGKGTHAAPTPNAPAVRTLVIHGTSDTTVAPINGQRVVEQACQAFSDAGISLLEVDLGTSCAGARTEQRVQYLDNNGRAQVVHVRVNGAGHAWFGGAPTGSYTDPQGPDASAEVVRFFLGDLTN